MDPSDILLPEIWELVFEKLEDPQDWLNLYRSSSYFQEVVGGKRTTALFPQVLPHLFDLDYFSAKGNLCDILRLRLVSRPWKSVVDKMVEKEENSGGGGGSVRFWLKYAYKFFGYSTTHISSFLDKFDETHSSGNPFVGRFALFHYDYFGVNPAEEVRAEYARLVTRLLHKFGPQLKTLEVWVSNTDFNHCVRRLQSCLRFVPNVESFTLHVHKIGNDNGGDEAIINEVEPHPPLLPNLKSFSYFPRDVEPAAAGILHNVLVRLCCNPNSLTSVETNGFPTELLNYPYLESAEVTFFDGDTPWILDPPPPPPITPPSCPLSMLTVHSFLRGNLAPLLKFVEVFQATLTSLCFQERILFPHSSFKTLKYKLDLPRLKHLTFQEKDYSSMSPEFIRNLAALEVLSFATHQRPEEIDRGQAYYEGNVVIKWRLWEKRHPKLTRICLTGPHVPSGGRKWALYDSRWI